MDIPLPSSETSDSDKENSSLGSFKSTQQVVTELVEIQEVDEEEAQVVLDAMDAQVQSCLYQCCKSKNHPSRYHPFPKDWMNGGYVGCQSFQGPSEQEQVQNTKLLMEGLNGDADVETNDESASSGN